jgi:hypothetical protein
MTMPSLLESFIPEPRLIEVDSVEVAVPPAEAYQILRHFDMARSPIVWALFWLRTLPERLRRSDAPPLRLRIDDIGAGGHGFHFLADEPGRAFVVGAVGRFWEAEIPFVDVTAADFAAFADPGFGKVAWEARFEPLGTAGTRIVLELRVTATDNDAWQRLRRYFRLLGPFSRFIRRHLLSQLGKELDLAAEPDAAHATPEPHAETPAPHPHDTWADVGQGAVGALGILADLATPFLRGARSHWGIARETAERSYPGDELVPAPLWGWTHGIEIDAPAAEVWPWVVQIGQNKGGFYSYQWLENLAGCDIQNADRIHPEWQTLQLGDTFSLHRTGPTFPIVDIEPGRYFLVHGFVDVRDGQVHLLQPAPGPLPPHHINLTWLFLVEPLGPRWSRFISRYRLDCSEDLTTRLAFGPWIIEPIGFMMDRRMLLGVKERVERSAQMRSEEPAPGPGA